jgi:hypothetical protein
MHDAQHSMNSFQRWPLAVILGTNRLGRRHSPDKGRLFDGHVPRSLSAGHPPGHVLP